MTDTAFLILLSNDKIMHIAAREIQETNHDGGWEPVNPLSLDIPVGVDTLRIELPSGCLETRIPGVHETNRTFTVPGQLWEQELPWRDC